MANVSLDILLKMRAEMSQVRQAQREIQKLGDHVKALNAMLGYMGLPILGAASFGIAASGLKELVSYGSSLKTISGTIGITAEQLQKMRQAADMFNVSGDSMDQGLTRLAKGIAGAAAGKGELVELFKEYDIQAKDANGRTRDTVTILRELADKVKAAATAEDRLRIVTKALGEGNAQLVGLLKDGSTGFDQLIEQAGRAVPIVGDEMVEALDKMDGRVKDLSLTIKNDLTRALGGALALFDRLAAHETLRTQAYAELLKSRGVELSGKENEAQLVSMARRRGIKPEEVSRQVSAIIQREAEAAYQKEKEAQIQAQQAVEDAKISSSRRITEAAIGEQQKLQQFTEAIHFEQLGMEEKYLFVQGKIVEALKRRTDETLSEEERIAAIKEQYKWERALVEIRAKGGDQNAAKERLESYIAIVDLAQRQLGIERELVEARTDLTVAQKQAQLADITERMAFNTAGMINAWQEYASVLPEGSKDRLEIELKMVQALRDQADLRERLDRIPILDQTKQRAREIQIGTESFDPGSHFETFGDAAQGAAFEYIAEAGTAADRLHDSLMNIGSTLEGSIADGLYGLITGTMEWDDALRHVGVTIASTILQSLIRMAVQWMIQQALMAAFGQSLQVASLGATAAMSSAALMLWTPAAVAASIATFGGAMANGPAAMMMIQASRFAAFEKGGLVGGGEQLIRVNEKGPEFVMNARATAMNLPILKAMNEGMPVTTLAPMSGGSTGGSTGQSGSTSRPGKSLNVLVYSREEAFQVVKRHPDFEATVSDVVYRSRGELL